jgi:hypothetical protein
MVVMINSARDKCFGLVDIGKRGAGVEYYSTRRKEDSRSTVHQGKLTTFNPLFQHPVALFLSKN